MIIKMQPHENFLTEVLEKVETLLLLAILQYIPSVYRKQKKWAAATGSHGGGARDLRKHGY